MPEFFGACPQNTGLLVVVGGVVVVGVVVVGTGGSPVQETLRSLLVPVDVNVMKPGWLEEIWLLIQVWYWDTLA